MLETLNQDQRRRSEVGEVDLHVAVLGGAEAPVVVNEVKEKIYIYMFVRDIEASITLQGLV